MLELSQLSRPNSDLGGGHQSARESLDFVIDGQRLSVLLGGESAARLCFRQLGCDPDPEWEQRLVEQLLLHHAPDFPESRYALYVCPECGDFGCGTVTAVIERVGDSYVWRDFGWQTNYEDTVYYDDYRHLGPYQFDAVEYESVLRSSYLR